METLKPKLRGWFDYFKQAIGAPSKMRTAWFDAGYAPYSGVRLGSAVMDAAAAIGTSQTLFCLLWAFLLNGNLYVGNQAPNGIITNRRAGCGKSASPIGGKGDV